MGKINSYQRVAENEIEEIKATRTLLAEKNLKGIYSDEIYKEMDQKLKIICGGSLLLELSSLS